MYNNGPHMFGLVRRYITDSAARKLHQIARRYDARFVHAGKIPGNSIRGWFESDNLGEPFNGAVTRAVLCDVQDEHPRIAAALGLAD